MAIDSPRLPVRHVAQDPRLVEPPQRGRWPVTLPAVRQLLDDGLELGALTVLVGENGSGKSTVVEGIASAYGLSPEGGSTGARHSTRPTESELGHWLALRRGIGASRWGFFLRAETMHGFYTYLEEHGSRAMNDPRFHEMSHGESFIAMLRTRFTGAGLYVLDEPESALSFTGCLALVAVLTDLAALGTAQVIVATHSPIVAALPGASIYELGEWGLRRCEWDDLEVVGNWREFLADPQSLMRVLFDQ